MPSSISNAARLALVAACALAASAAAAQSVPNVAGEPVRLTREPAATAPASRTVRSQPRRAAPSVESIAATPARVDPVLERVREWQARGALAPAMEQGVLRYPYGALVPVLVCAPLHVCTIELEPGEQVQGVMLGDTARWKYALQSQGDTPVIGIKPDEPGLRTNGTILTDRRTYTVELKSAEGDYVPRMGFFYPQQFAMAFKRRAEAEREQAAAKSAETARAGIELPALDKVKFGYRVVGSAEFRPVRVFTDGKKTYLQLPASVAASAAPAFTVLDTEGQALLANFRVHAAADGSLFYIVDRVVARAELYLGAGNDAARVRIERDAALAANEFRD